ncbi:selenoprotein S [Corythoichthys intestinalis]|uniref:selenoprotein S n=1 Tax=Corythoichthys intestinalis TaxID=161448 RepID=UPI0025A5E3DE|nr:selenoprotein S [Corythoichthys intestinalis]
MDDVEITDVDENGEVLEAEEPKQLKNNDPSSVLFLTAGDVLSAYGWYLLAALAAAYALVLYLGKRRSGESDAATPSRPQDAEAVVRRQEAVEASRRRMQLEQDAKAAVFREKQKLAEEEKRRQKIQEWESMQLGKSFKGASRRLQSDDADATAGTSVKPKTDKKPLRSSEYNPLSGEGGGSCSWRPGRRGPASGG